MTKTSPASLVASTLDSPTQAPQTASSRQPAPILSVRKLSVTIDRTPIFTDIQFDLPPQQILGVLGPSGAGKSTLLRCLNRLIDLTPRARATGEIRFDGGNLLDRRIDTDALRARIAMIFQQPVVFPTSIERNVLFGLRHLRRIPRREAPQLAEKALREAALWDQVKDRLKAPAAQLSIGQQQRICLARALASEPDVLLLDEPTSALDPDTAAEIEERMLALRATRSLILVTHNPAQAERVCDRILRFEANSRG